MKNVLVCKNCGTENPFYTLNCAKCDSYLRARVSNIDLWQTIWQIFESPVKAGEKIIHSEHKNFVISLLVLIAVKYATVSAMIFNSTNGRTEGMNVFPQAFIAGGIPIVVLIVFISTLLKFSNNALGIKNRVVDNIALYTFCLVPQILGFVFITPIHFALFGEYFFSFNPSPFLIKPIAAYVLLGIEILLFGWSMVTTASLTFAQTRNKTYSIAVAFGFTILMLASIYFLPGEFFIFIK